MTRQKHEKEDVPEKWELIDKKDSTVDDMIEMELLNNKTIILHGELSEEVSNKVCKKLLFLFMKGKRDAYLILNSVGGEIYHGLLVFNTLEDLKKKGMIITIEARGLCASMGVSVLMGGSKRIASKYTRFLLHESTSWTYGKVSEQKEGIEENVKVDNMLDQIIAERTHLTLKKIKQSTKKRDWWLSADEALKYGLIEAIV